MRFLRALLTGLGVAVMAFAAYVAGARATRERQLEQRETELARKVTTHTTAAREARGRAREHGRRAETASAKAKQRISALAERDPELEKLFDEWHR